jgi:3',5'-cyclic AMP phosphodiesterase CpdA
MRVLVHISDIHFGRVNYSVVNRLTETINEIAPHLVVVSGDLTQRARSHQFIEARAFLDQLPKPQIVVPGNHDVPLYNVYKRFVQPLKKYKKFITNDLQPFYADTEIAVAGLNTARSLTIKDGSINENQIAGVRDKMCRLEENILKMVVTHHPFDLPSGLDHEITVKNSEKAIPLITDCGADVFLSGHLHVSHVGQMTERYKLPSGRKALLIQAGTATSVRGRGEANSFNVIEFEHPRLTVKRLECQTVQTGFVQVEQQEFTQTKQGWKRKKLI